MKYFQRYGKTALVGVLEIFVTGMNVELGRA